MTVEPGKEYNPQYRSLQVVLIVSLLSGLPASAVNRSGLVREALREHPKRLEVRELEARDRMGYQEHPDDSNKAANWVRRVRVRQKLRLNLQSEARLGTV